MEYLNKLHDFGVINIEMECTIFAALTYHAGIRSAIVCVTLLDRLKGDQVRICVRYINDKFVFFNIFLFLSCNFFLQVNTPKEVMHEWQIRPQILVSRLIKKHLALDLSLKPLLVGGTSICSPRRFKLVQQESEAHE